MCTRVQHAVGKMLGMPQLMGWNLRPGRLGVQCEVPSPPCASQSPGEHLKNRDAQAPSSEILTALTDDGVQVVVLFQNPPGGSTVQLGFRPTGPMGERWGQSYRTEVSEEAEFPLGVPGEAFFKEGPWFSK